MEYVQVYSDETKVIADFADTTVDGLHPADTFEDGLYMSAERDVGFSPGANSDSCLIALFLDP